MCSRLLSRSARLQPGKRAAFNYIIFGKELLVGTLSPFAHMTFLKQQRWTEVAVVVV